jgi:hypothetical protein
VERKSLSLDSMENIGQGDKSFFTTFPWNFKRRGESSFYSLEKHTNLLSLSLSLFNPSPKPL